MLYLFDLDDTLIRTNDLKIIREAGRDADPITYAAQLISFTKSRSDRVIWSEDDIMSLGKLFKLSDDEVNHIGVFSRSPRLYVQTLLNHFYPNIEWDVVITYEDVAPKFKPHGYGILLARERTGEEAVMMIGDSAADIKAAYHAISYVAWDETKIDGKFDYVSYDLLPDFIFSHPNELIKKISEPYSYMMPLEVPLSQGAAGTAPIENSRSMGFFCPDNAHHLIRVLGKHFSRYTSIKAIRAFHELTVEVENCKSATEFPARWVSVLLEICREQIKYFGKRRPEGRVVLTCIPARPGRPHRLGVLVAQCEAAYRATYGFDRVVFKPDIFGFRNGVRSNSNDHLNRAERFDNLSKYLFISTPEQLHTQDTLVVIDDVVTSGSSLISAKKLLEQLSVGSIQLIGISKNIGEIMPERWRGEALYGAQ
jgi:FMN phosphatase YigB (HAD superfamily)